MISNTMAPFVPIREDHPYLNQQYSVERPTSSLHMIYEPAHNDWQRWPLYQIQVRRLSQGGFTIEVASKGSQGSHWETCEYFNPIPFSLAGEILTMMQEVCSSWPIITK